MMVPNIYPSLAEFKRFAKKGNLIPLFADIVADSITPVSLLSSQWSKSPHCFLLESVEGGENLGRYSFVSFSPRAVVEQVEAGTRVKDLHNHHTAIFKGSAWAYLKKTMKGIKPVPIPGLPRFFGGAVGYSSYDIVRDFEKIPRVNPDPQKWARSTFFLTMDLFIFDNSQQLLKLVTCVQLSSKSDLDNIYRLAKNRLLRNLDRLSQATNAPRFQRKKKRPAVSKAFTSNVSRQQYIDSVERAKERISRGDIIQVVLSRRMERSTTASPLDIYRCLRVVNPSPYMYLMKVNDRALIGSSPELLIRLEDGQASTRPIAGTRSRGASERLDDALEKELLADPKERAEHVMLVDLGRNDLGRECRYGSVKIPVFMKVERFSHVMHIVSEVTGRLKAGRDSFDLFKATFPAGTVSGAPKIRAMEIINELEIDQRGPYAGAMGYFSYSGNMDMAITIRTILWKAGLVSVQAGAGIVADSNPAREFEETEKKARGMKETVSLAESGKIFWRGR